MQLPEGQTAVNPREYAADTLQDVENGARRGRPPGQFAAKRAQVMRWLMDNLREDITNQEIAQAMGCSLASAKRYVAALVKEGYLRAEVARCKDVGGQFWTERKLYYTGKRGIV